MGAWAQQYVTYAAILHSDAATIATRVTDLCNRSFELLRTLSAVVSSHAAVPTAEVYPHFIALADLYVYLHGLASFQVSGLIRGLSVAGSTHSPLPHVDVQVR